MKPIIISIIGAPGIGKSFLSEKLAQYLKSELILESVQNIPDRIIDNLRNNIRPTETILWFRNRFIKNIEKASTLKKEGKSVIMDSSLISNALHITTMVKGFKREILLQQAQFDEKYIPKPDVTIFLDGSEKTIKNLTMQRGRDFDTNNDFIKRNLSIRNAHQKYYQENKDLLIYINRDNLDFTKEKDLLEVIDKII